MKRLLSIFLALTLILSLCTCKKENTNSSEASTSTFSQTESTNSEIKTTSDASQVNTESITTTPSKPINNQIAITSSTCSHNYKNVTTVPTCTKQGFTTHTCTKCNYSFSDNYVAAGHNYSNYKCTSCGTIDKTHTYEYLVNWILKNGETNGNYCELKHTPVDLDANVDISILYDSSSNSVILTYFHKRDDEYEYNNFTALTINKISSSYIYSSLLENPTNNMVLFDFSGYLNCNIFTVNSPISYKTWESDIGYTDYTAALNLARFGISTILAYVSLMLAGEVEGYTDSGLTLSDLGFTSFVREDFFND